MDDFPSNSNFSNKGVRPIALVSQLLQLVPGMHHIDEIFMWITVAMVKHFGVVSAQIWANQANSRGEIHQALRASASQNTYQALQVFESSEVRSFIKRMLHEQRNFWSIPVTNIFSQYQAMLLVQQNCRYATVYFFSQDVLLPFSQSHPGKDEVSTPLQITFSLFTQQPIQSSQARAMSFLIEQAFRIAMSHELFSGIVKEEDRYLSATHLIPEHMQITDVEQGDNPFSNAVVIPEKRVRQMYNMMDGKKDIQEIALMLNMNYKEALEVVKSLLLKRYITLRGMDGKIVTVSSFSEMAQVVTTKNLHA